MDGGTVRLPKLIGLSRANDMILTGRPVEAREAFHIGNVIRFSSLGYIVYVFIVFTGLANRLVPEGQALTEAKLLAKQLLLFPQLCLRQDLSSTCESAFTSLFLQKMLRKEFEGGKEVLEQESVKGARQFVSGEGRGGVFNH